MQFLAFIKFAKNLSSFVVGPEGNISWRWKDDSFVIKASGSNMSKMSKDSIVTCDMDGNKTSSSSARPSMEVGFHSWLYKNTGCKVIAHTHPTNVMKVLCGGLTEEFAKQRLFPDQVVFNGRGACVVPYATPGQELVEEIASATKDLETVPNLFLLENHGVICCGKDFQEALVMTQVCDKAAEIFLGAKSHQPKYLTEQQINSILTHDSEVYRKNL